MIYEFTSHHYAPKDSHSATSFFIDAENEEELYNAVRKQLWWDCMEEEEHWSPELVIEHKGDNTEELTSFSDLYYGLTTYSWTECPGLTKDDFLVLEKAGMTSVER